MREAIREALKGRGRTHPNPAVGAVLVRDGEIVGRGYHHGPGKDHAEVEALREAGRLARGADLYVTLEPCNAFGRTPPCTKALLAAGVGGVFIAVTDPNAKVNGAGAEELRAAGLRVQLGLLEEEAVGVDPAYHIFHSRRRPFVHLKIAQSLDGCVVAPGGGYITGEAARLEVHRDRFESDAILVSANTVRADDPELTVRIPGRTKAIVRVCLDSGCSLTGKERLFKTLNGGEVWVVRPEEKEGEPALLPGDLRSRAARGRIQSRGRVEDPP